MAGLWFSWRLQILLSILKQERSDKKKQEGKGEEQLSGSWGGWGVQDELSDSSRILIFQMIRKQAPNLGMGLGMGHVLHRKEQVDGPHPEPVPLGPSSAVL